MENENIVYALGKIITNYRENHHPKLNTREFADKCGISKSIIYSIEANTYNSFLGQSTLYKIAKGLDLRDDLELRTLIEQTNNDSFSKTTDESPVITIHPNSRLYAFFNLVKDLDEERIEMLHNLVINFKK